MRRIALALCLLAAACRQPEVHHDAAMRAALADMRYAIATYHQQTGRYPHALSELVPRYLRAIPDDPVTGKKTTWRFETEETVAPSADFTKSETAATRSVIIDVRSGATGTDAAGKRWSDY
ncbi:MAG TPA: type II secretion system protein G [Thermoanaerobaculia bacterium]|nr:type II secretion system protein G [Thermoanaerobaculia bacterium]